jgi:hypothetical protein
MNKYDEMIVKYLDEQLSDKERIEFECELKTNAELKNIFENYKKVNELFSTGKEPNVDQDYFNGIVPQFRQKLEKETYTLLFRKIGYAFATILMLISSYLLFQNYFFNHNLADYSIQSITDNLSEEELNELTNYISNEPWEMLSDEENYANLNDDYFNLEGIISNASAEEAVMIFSEYEINEIYSIVGEDDFEIAYNEILTKRIF